MYCSCSAMSCLKRRIWIKSMMAAVMAESVSLTGRLHHTPCKGSAVNKSGSKSVSGIRYSTCRVRLRKMACFALPILVKRLIVTI